MSPVDYHDAAAWRYVFSAPLECGLRCVMLLAASFPRRCDLQRLTQYEYLLVHSGDVSDGPPSLHPASPQRGGELLVRRRLVERGLKFVESRGLCCGEATKSGVLYSAGDWAAAFLERLSEPYSVELIERARWVIGRFGQMGDRELAGFMRSNWSLWGSEFEAEAVFRGEMP